MRLSDFFFSAADQQRKLGFDWLSVFNFRAVCLCRHQHWPSAARGSTPQPPLLLPNSDRLRAWKSRLVGGEVDFLVISFTDSQHIIHRCRSAEQSDLHLGWSAHRARWLCGWWTSACGGECDLHFCGLAAADAPAAELHGWPAAHGHHARAEGVSLWVSVKFVVNEGSAEPQTWKSWASEVGLPSSVTACKSGHHGVLMKGLQTASCHRFLTCNAFSLCLNPQRNPGSAWKCTPEHRVLPCECQWNVP